MSKRIIAALSLALTAISVVAQKATYAPTPPPMLVNDQKAKAAQPQIAQAAAQFSVGDPTDEEQMHLELINRARADANAEALRLIALAAINQDVFDQFVTSWHVDAELMKTQFAALSPAPPLSFNARLINAARAHSQYQFDNAIQTHFGSGGSTVSDRITAAGYTGSNLGENVFLNAISPEHGHAAFDIDWGPGPGGMQTPAGHRDTIHNNTFVEVGIGIVKGFNTVNGNEAGPQVVTQDFGRPQTATTYITGVAYYDINGNNFYDMGEGLPGVTVTVDGVSPFAVTTTSGAYSVPVPPNRAHTVRFNSTGRAEVTRAVTLTAANSKVDFTPSYVVPTIASGPTTAFVGIDNVYTIAPLPGATGYRARITQTGAIAPEGAEGNLDRLTITTTGGYDFISTARKASGAQSFHLGHVLDTDLNTIHPQFILFNDQINAGANARIDFQSMMAVAGTGQFAALEVSENDGGSWTELWSQSGADVAGEETSFSAKSVSLAAYEGKTIRVRFLFDVNGQAFLLDPLDPNFNRIGWYLDDVTFVNMETVIGTTESAVLSEPKFVFKPAETGSYNLEFQAITGARAFEYGPAQAITVNSEPPLPSFFRTIATTATTITLEFGLELGSATAFTLVSAPSVAGPWSTETSAAFTGPDQGRYIVTVPRNGEVRFYRVGAN